ncbi:hypothetical protein [Enterobacter cloacae complex sp. 301C7]|uniref:hypothetical protein n=1 Tax=Enterobacter cloacae complex sp. 301C7 TaxID=3395848 RepID=UPI003CF417C6
MNSVHKVLMSKDLIPAKMDGYYFSPQEDVYRVLDRNNQINKKAVTDVLNDNLKEGYLNTIALFARELSRKFCLQDTWSISCFYKGRAMRICQ